MLYLIIGAAYQGKRSHAEQQYRLMAGREPAVGDGSQVDLAASLDWPVIDHLHEALRRLPADENLYQAAIAGWLDELDRLRQQDPARLQIIILDEIGAGLVPLDAGDRLWRERCGRLGCRLAEAADRVDRVWCGLPVNLKASR